jgi:hypothetical protein
MHLLERRPSLKEQQKQRAMDEFKRNMSIKYNRMMIRKYQAGSSSALNM